MFDASCLLVCWLRNHYSNLRREPTSCNFSEPASTFFATRLGICPALTSCRSFTAALNKFGNVRGQAIRNGIVAPQAFLNPPLCRNCTLALTKPQDLEEYTDISRTFARIKTSAELGCYLCSILYDADWAPRDSYHSDLSLTEKLWDMKPPQAFSCNIHQTEEEAEYGYFHVEAFAAKVEDQERIWYLSNRDILVIPISYKDLEDPSSIMQDP
jgi:hypothetical protein